MDLRLLGYFVVVAELEHVGKAAERLHISQSPLSRQIRQLETDLGMELFVRERQRIRLTDSGRWLLLQARGLLGHSEKIREEAGQRARGETGTLAISFVSAAMWSGALPRLLRRFQNDFPGAKLALRNLRSTAQAEAVSSGQVDVGFTSSALASNHVQVTCVAEEPAMLVLPADHSLKRKRAIAPRDLDGVRWIFLAETHSSEHQARFLADCVKAGFTPQVVQHVAEPSTLLSLIESGLGVGLIRASARHYAPRSLVFRALPWLKFRSRTYMIRAMAGRSPLAEKFVASALRLWGKTAGPS